MPCSPWRLVLAILLVPTVTRGADLLTNGSFEQGPDLGGQHDVTLLAESTVMPGWTIFGHSIDFNGPPWDVSDGAHAVDLDGRDAVLSGVSQTFATVAGRTYIVSFDLSGNAEGPPVVKRVRVTVDGFSQDYDHDSTGQTKTSLLWQSISFSFVASGTTATLSFMSLQETANSFGPLIDRVRVEELEEGGACAYSFSSGEGDALIHYCVSANGTIVELEGPAGQEHINVGVPWEGFVICTGTTVQAWDLTATANGFGASSQHGRQASTGVTLRRTSADYQLEQVFRLDKDEKDVTIEMTLTNIKPRRRFASELAIDARVARNAWRGGRRQQVRAVTRELRALLAAQAGMVDHVLRVTGVASVPSQR
jgi:choice-of-anchor C domain-containing protein